MIACVFGASGGIGKALVARLSASSRYSRVFALSRKPPASLDGRAVTYLPFDLTDEASVAKAATLMAQHGPLDLVMLATGILHDADRVRPEKSWSALDPAVMERVFAINAIGPALIAKHMLPLLAKDRRAIFAALSARVGSIGDNRLGGWHSYRASKAALHMLIRNFAIEFARRNPQGLVVALHPGTVDTSLSQPFQRNVSPDTLLTPDQSASHLLALLDGLEPRHSGAAFAWDGQPIPY